ncbi:MAG: hypothetical protein FJW34_16580 [Acidobacteria bacterium]|nr:hypothetical protein [Acidobacteriota bacterium]
MSYVRINATTEYDPITRTIRQDGQTRAAGFAALGFSTLLEVQQQFRGEGAGQEPAAPPATPSASLRGQLSPSGAPLIVASVTPAANPWGYTGPAARNPYYVTPGTPMEDGAVQGYEKWFQPAQVLQAHPTTGSVSIAYSMRVVTEEGAREALRLVQEYLPEATLEATVFGAGGGPWRADRPSYQVALPCGERLNAAAVLDSYYNRGQGVTALSDFMLRDELRWLSGHVALS